jgi:hypothetical protein
MLNRETAQVSRKYGDVVQLFANFTCDLRLSFAASGAGSVGFHG